MSRLRNIHPVLLERLESQLPEGVSIEHIGSVTNSYSEVIVVKNGVKSILKLDKVDIENKLITSIGRVTVPNREVTVAEALSKFIEEHELYLLPDVDYILPTTSEELSNYIRLNISTNSAILKGSYQIEVVVSDDDVNMDGTCPTCYLKTRVFLNTKIFKDLDFNIFNGKKLSSQFQKHLVDVFNEEASDFKLKPNTKTFKGKEYLEAFNDGISDVVLYDAANIGLVTIRYETFEEGKPVISVTNTGTAITFDTPDGSPTEIVVGEEVEEEPDNELVEEPQDSVTEDTEEDTTTEVAEVTEDSPIEEDVTTEDDTTTEEVEDTEEDTTTEIVVDTEVEEPIEVVEDVEEESPIEEDTTTTTEEDTDVVEEEDIEVEQVEEDSTTTEEDVDLVEDTESEEEVEVEEEGVEEDTTTEEVEDTEVDTETVEEDTEVVDIEVEEDTTTEVVEEDTTEEDIEVEEVIDTEVEESTDDQEDEVNPDEEEPED